MPHTPTFDGDNLVVTLPAPAGDTLSFDVQDHLYSEWKEWMLLDFQNQGFPPLFTTFGGDSITDTLNAGAYYTFNNVAGWRIRPGEKDHDVNWVGSLIALDTSLPVFIPTIGGFTVFVNGLQPITTVAVVGSGVTQQDKDDIEAQIFAHVTEDSETFEQMLRLVRASSAGDIIQLPNGDYLIKSKDGLTDRIDGSLGDNNSRIINATDSS